MGAYQGRPALIFAAGPETEYHYIRNYLEMHPNAVIACADGGVRHAYALGLTPDIVIGDFDSYLDSHQGKEFIRLCPEKDDTDTQHCLIHLINCGCTEITVVCATGGRLDHLLANLSLCEQANALGGRCAIMDKQNLVFLHEGGCQHFKMGQTYQYFSIIPLDAVLYNVTIIGAKYPLKGATISRPGMISISNEPSSEVFTIEIGQGAALIVLSRDL